MFDNRQYLSQIPHGYSHKANSGRASQVAFGNSVKQLVLHGAKIDWKGIIEVIFSRSMHTTC
jgi:hypothetical protein